MVTTGLGIGPMYVLRRDSKASKYSVPLVVDVHPAFLPQRKLVGLGQERSKRRPVEGLKGFAARLAQVAHRPVIQFVEQHPDAGIQVCETEESAIAIPEQAIGIARNS